MDTPGIHRTRTALHKSMVDAAFAAFQEVDIISDDGGSGGPRRFRLFPPFMERI